MPTLNKNAAGRFYVRVSFGVSDDEGEHPDHTIIRAYLLKEAGVEYLETTLQGNRGDLLAEERRAFGRKLFNHLCENQLIEAHFGDVKRDGHIASGLHNLLKQWANKWKANQVPDHKLLNDIDDHLISPRLNLFLALERVCQAVEEAATRYDPQHQEEFQKQQTILFKRVREAFPEDTEIPHKKTYISADGSENVPRS